MRSDLPADFEGVLKRYGTGLDTRWRGGTRNPFTFFNAATGEKHVLVGEDAAGWGVPLEGPDDEARDLATVIRAYATENGGTSARARSVFGGEFGGRVLAVSPNWLNWTAGSGRGAGFGTRRQARTLIEADALSAAGLTGKDVNVLIVDQGIDAGYVAQLGGTFGGGFIWDAGSGEVFRVRRETPSGRRPGPTAR